MCKSIQHLIRTIDKYIHMLMYEYTITDTENLGRESKVQPRTGHEGLEEE
jgi:hypothetical protein